MWSMPILEKLKSMVWRGERTFTYRCEECETVFEAATPSRSQTSCPSCGGKRIISTPEATA